MSWRGTQDNFALSEISWETISLASQDEISIRRDIRRLIRRKIFSYDGFNSSNRDRISYHQRVRAKLSPPKQEADYPDSHELERLQAN